MGAFYPTKHLIEKLDAREITWSEIVDILDHPEVIYGPDNRGRRVMQRSDLSIVVGRDGAVITALLRSSEQWTDEEAKRRKNGR